MVVEQGTTGRKSPEQLSFEERQGESERLLSRLIVILSQSGTFKDSLFRSFLSGRFGETLKIPMGGTAKKQPGETTSYDLDYKVSPAKTIDSDIPENFDVSSWLAKDASCEVRVIRNYPGGHQTVQLSRHIHHGRDVIGTFEYYQTVYGKSGDFTSWVNDREAAEKMDEFLNKLEQELVEESGSN